MADDREPYQPLWATGLARPARPPEPEPEPEPEPPRPPAPRFPARFAAVTAVAASAVLLAAALLGRGAGDVSVADLPSAWGDIPMTCATTRIEGATKTIELFRCRAEAGSLPPGLYRSPGTIWSSDVDRRPSLEHRIRISPSGRLTGSAVYVP